MDVKINYNYFFSDQEVTASDGEPFSEDVATLTDPTLTDATLIDIKNDLHNLYIVDFLLFAVISISIFQKMLHRVIYNHTKEM